jgi:hypothetical protein
VGRQSIYIDAQGNTRLHQRGFSWFAAFLLPVWAVRHRLYGTAISGAIVGGVMAFASTATLLADRTWIQLTLSVLVVGTYGAAAPRWHAYLLRRAGYRVAAQEPD